MPTLGQLIGQIAQGFGFGSALSSSGLFDEDFGGGRGGRFNNFLSTFADTINAPDADNSVMQNLFAQNLNPIISAPSAFQENPAPELVFASPFSSAATSSTLSSGFVLTGPISNAVINGDGGDNTITGTPDPDTLSGFGGNDIISGLDSGDTIYGGTGNDVIYAYDSTTGDGSGGGGGTSTVVDYFEGFDAGTAGYVYTEQDPAGVTLTGSHELLDGDTANGSLEVDINRTGTYGFSYGIFSESITITQDMVGAELTFSYRHTHNTQNDNGEDSYIWSQLNGGGFDLLNTALGSGGATDTGWVTYTYALGAVSVGDTITIDLAHGHAGANRNNEDSVGRFDDITISGDITLPGSGSGGGAPSTTLDAGTINSLYGEDGDDEIYGAAGNDFLYGGADDDILFGGFGNDTLNGGTGADTLDGHDGIDTLDYSGSTGAVNVNLTTNTVSGGDAAGDTIANFENIIGGDGNDTLTGDGNVNVIEGGDGIDTINAGNGDDIVYGGNGADIINGGTGADTLHGTASLDVSAILAANPNISYSVNTGSFYQFVNTGANLTRDAADTAANAATLSGAPGLSGHLATITTQIESDFIDGIRDTSNAWIAGSDSAVEGEWTWDRGDETGVRFSDAVGNAVNGMFEAWIAGQPNDSNGTQNFLYILENGGNVGWADAPNAPPGNFVDIGSYVIEWEAGSGADDNAADTINGGNGDDYIYGYGGNDILNGQNDDDVIYGGDGNDDIDGGAGNDDLYGGAGADDINGGTGIDTVYYNTEVSDITVNLDGSANAGGEATGDVLSNIEVVYTGSGDDTFNGAGGDATLYGGAGEDTFYAGGGDDTFNGEDGYDTVYFSGDYDDYTVTSNGIVAGIESFTVTDNNAGDGDDGTDTTITVERLVFNDLIIDVSDPSDREYSPTDIILSSETFDASETAGTTIATMSSVDLDVGDTHTYTFVDGDTDIFNIVGNQLQLTVDANEFENEVFYLNIRTTDSFGFTYDEDFFISVLGADTNTGDNNVNIIIGTANDEGLYGLGGNDIINGGDGDDAIFGGDGSDTMDGGAGFDTVHFDTARTNLTVNLATNTVTGGGITTGDTFTNFEAVSTGIGDDNITGTSGKNSLYGNRGNDTINGGDGDDKIWGGDGADILDGGAGFDFLRYDFDITGVNVNLGNSTASGGHAQGDVFTNFEGVTGGLGNDTLTGGAGNDRLDGNGGNDTLIGGNGNDVIRTGSGTDNVNAGSGDDNVYSEAGADVLDGGTGIDTLRYENDTVGVNVNLATGVGTGGNAQGDTISNFENLNGGYGNDVLTGDGGRNVITGRGGSDTLNGGGGNDILYGNDDNDILNGGDGNDFIYAGGGGDAIDGGAGIDTVRYIDDTAGLNINLANGTGSGGLAQGDTYTSIENFDGGAGNDIITGDGAANRLKGNAGNDTVSGGGGNDYITGARGDDTLNGDAGNDRLYGYDDNDILNGGAGFDTLAGGNGADTFILDTTDADRITDFNQGQNDVLDISGLLSGFNGGSDINDFVMFEVSGPRTKVFVDQDGAGGNFVQIAALENNTALDVDTLYTNGQIIAM